MVIIDQINMMSFQKPYRPTSKSSSLVITLPKIFTSLMGITSTTKLALSLSKEKDSLMITKVDEDQIC